MAMDEDQTEDQRCVLLPIDFSSDSQPALEYAVGLAREHRSELVLVHVVEPLPRGASRWCNPSEVLEERAEAARKQLERFEKRALGLYRHCRSELHFGTTAQVIAELARNLKAGLIVVSTRRRTGILDRLLQGLPEKLMRLAPCPVLAVQSDPPSRATAETHPVPAGA
jgi:nucleotide-binding universal stress UspA family protein